MTNRDIFNYIWSISAPNKDAPAFIKEIDDKVKSLLDESLGDDKAIDILLSMGNLIRNELFDNGVYQTVIMEEANKRANGRPDEIVSDMIKKVIAEANRE